MRYCSCFLLVIIHFCALTISLYGSFGLSDFENPVKGDLSDV
jgi:hypothetical protein